MTTREILGELIGYCRRVRRKERSKRKYYVGYRMTII